MHVETIEAWHIAACTNLKSPVRASKLDAKLCLSECADFPWMPAAVNHRDNRRCACRIETR